MQKTAVTSVAISPLIASRWSPRAFDSAYKLSSAEMVSILEAGRWAPSANNGQPWRFSVALRESEVFASVVAATTGFNQAWLPSVAAVILVSVPLLKADGSEYKSAGFDAGLATQNILLQAAELGLAGHVVGGMDFDAMRAAVSLSADLRPVVLIAVGKAADAAVLAGTPAYDREIADRSRLPLTDLVLSGLPS